ncbi:MAG: hypothetical protein DCC68_05300 [Planctomycetota bacterium]|nr:MAG: hypothetical protein DCC68_05300 [Planctomycetota bacterium]
MKKPLDRTKVNTLAEEIDAYSKAGIGLWNGAEIAPIAVRRWSSFDRRHKTKHPTTADRVSDLAKGLQAHYEPDMPYTHMTEWMNLAELIAKFLDDLWE